MEKERKDEVEVDKEKDKAPQEAEKERAWPNLMPMDVFKEFENLSLKIKTSLGTALVMADPHIGFEFSKGLRIRTNFEKLLSEFIVDNDPDLVILLGDVKDPLGMNNRVRELLDIFFSDLRGIDVIIIKGNHDGRIEEVAEKHGIKVTDHLILDGMLFVHGHKRLPDVKFSEAYLGHVHPVHHVQKGGIMRSTKVFVRVGRFLILPTVNPYLEGFPVSVGIRMVPFLREETSADVFLPTGLHIGRVKINL